MNDKVENLILEQLRGIRETLSDMQGQLDGLDTRVNGISIMMATVIGELHSLDARVEALEGKAK